MLPPIHFIPLMRCMIGRNLDPSEQSFTHKSLSSVQYRILVLTQGLVIRKQQIASFIFKNILFRFIAAISCLVFLVFLKGSTLYICKENMLKEGEIMLE